MLERTGNKSYSFGTDFVKKHFPSSTKWLGWVLETVSPAGNYYVGEIYLPVHDVGITIDTHKTTPEQDIKWKKYMDTWVGKKDRYILFTFDCVKFSTDEFNDAPQHY